MTRLITYTGNGSRKTPKRKQQEIVDLARVLYSSCWCRTGDAGGADVAFARGAEQRCTIIKPSDYYRGDWRGAWDLVCQVHPNIQAAEKYRNVLGRNPYQLLGWELDEYSAFLVTWTPNGKPVGGSAVNINIAMMYDIPVFNLATCTIDDVIQHVKGLKKTGDGGDP